MNDKQPWEFTCKTCGDHKLTVTHIWTILAGLASERWQDKAAELGDYGEFTEDDSASEPEEYEIFESENNPESDEFYVNCANCDREIEFGWSQPNRGGRIFPAECSDFIPGEYWPEPRYLDAWQHKHWLR
jgi:hypothetical protein